MEDDSDCNSAQVNDGRTLDPVPSQLVETGEMRKRDPSSVDGSDQKPQKLQRGQEETNTKRSSRRWMCLARKRKAEPIPPVMVVC